MPVFTSAHQIHQLFVPFKSLSYQVEIILFSLTFEPFFKTQKGILVVIEKLQNLLYMLFLPQCDYGLKMKSNMSVINLLKREVAT